MLKWPNTSDLILGLFVVFITAMLLIPIPTQLIDILLVVNISTAIVLLLVSIYLPNALSLLAFPSLLLLSTLFRLALNVATTRLILGDGYAGEVIMAFGNFLIRGEVIVGVIIFAIITVVNFLVVARGAQRVSEVAARFALDSMPGKQMAIDSELKAGLISQDEAAERRENLSRESQLYGAMDGAMRFVQGDAIAGIIIIMANILGGLYIGIVQEGLSFYDAIQTYTILTVGDGLVSQIPAILGSVCAGIIVTRISSGSNTTLGQDVGSQVFSNTGALLFAAILILAIGLLPGLPTAPFAIVALLLGGISFVKSRYLVQDGETHGGTLIGSRASRLSLERGSAQTKGISHLGSEELVLKLDRSPYYNVYLSKQSHFHSVWSAIAKEVYSSIGMRMPTIKVEPFEQSGETNFKMEMDGATVLKGKLPLDSSLVICHPSVASIYGLEVIREDRHPLNFARVFWSPNTLILENLKREKVIRSFDFFEFIGLKAVGLFIRNPELLFTIGEIQSLFQEFENKNINLAQQILERKAISFSVIAELLQEMVLAGINVRDFKRIMEAVAYYCSSNEIAVQDVGTFDFQELVSHVRLNRRRQLIERLSSGSGSLRVFELSESLEAELQGLLELSGRNRLAVDEQLEGELRRAFDSSFRQISEHGSLPAAVLLDSSVRLQVDLLCRAWNIPFRTVTFEEAAGADKIERLGRISV